MKCIVEVISDTLSKPSPMPVSQECFETLRGGMNWKLGVRAAACWAGRLGDGCVAFGGINDLTQQSLTECPSCPGTALGSEVYRQLEGL